MKLKRTKKLDIWLLTVGEPLPFDGESPRLHRTGILSEYLLKKGHSITWWNSTFDHQNRILRFNKTTILTINEYQKIILLYGGGYKRNVSWERIKDHKAIALEFKKHTSFLPKPDVIVSSFPPIELCEEALRYGKTNHVPVIIDYRDLWPEAFINLLPKYLRFLGDLFFYSINTRVKKIFKDANGIVGISKPFVEIALGKANRKWGSFDEVIYLGYPASSGSKIFTDDAKEYWTEKGIIKKEDILRICFFGNIAKRNLTLLPVIECARQLEKKGIKAEFIFCGKGDGLESYMKASRGIKSIHFPGFVNSQQIFSLMDISDVGILPYIPSIDFNNSIPNKAIEYLGGGLPIITSLHGHLGELIKKYDCGFIYDYDNSASLFDIIVELSKDKKILLSKKQNSLELFNKTFSADLVYSKMTHLIENISIPNN